jgi:ParB family transcriptional regulator, chromosome partitioning protein
MSRKALGRGLSALLRDVESASPSAPSLQQVPVGLIDPNPFQPRRLFSPDRLQELADSIRSTGIVQPILVRKTGERYQLIAGERRWRAASLARLETVPAMIRELSDQEALELALTENILRDDLSPIETARAYQSMQEKFGLSHDEIATRLGFNRTTITNAVRLLKLPQEIQEMIDKKLLTSGHARALLACTDAEEQVQLAKRIAEEGFSVRLAEKLASPLKNETSPRKTPASPEGADANTRAAALELERTLGTRVKILGNGDRGRIEISYFSAQDLERIYELIVVK